MNKLLTPTLSPQAGRVRDPSRSDGRVRGACCLALLLIPLTLAGCGKKNPPRPPPGVPNTYPRTYPSV